MTRTVPRTCFFKDMNTGAITCISIAGKIGANGASERAQISQDGRYILFESDANNLVDGDTNDKRDIFLKDLSSGTITRVSTERTEPKHLTAIPFKRSSARTGATSSSRAAPTIS